MPPWENFPTAVASCASTGTGVSSKPSKARHSACAANAQLALGTVCTACLAGAAVVMAKSSTKTADADTVMAISSTKTAEADIRSAGAAERNAKAAEEQVSLQKMELEVTVMTHTLGNPDACEADSKVAKRRMSEIVQELGNSQDSQTTPSPGPDPSLQSMSSGIFTDFTEFTKSTEEFTQECTEQILQQCKTKFDLDLKKCEKWVESNTLNGNGGIGPKGSKNAGGGSAAVMPPPSPPSMQGDMKKLGFSPKEAETATPPAK